jgi:hypothetical protein
VPTGRTRLLAALVARHVQFVVVEGGSRRRLRLAVSAHPANLAALGVVLGEAGATLRPVAVPRAGNVHRAAATLGTFRVHVPGVEVDVLLGSPGGSLYSELQEHAVEVERDGVLVLVAPEPTEPTTLPRGAVVADRILAMVDELATRIPPV